jgi:hypothetical protein
MFRKHHLPMARPPDCKLVIKGHRINIYRSLITFCSINRSLQKQNSLFKLLAISGYSGYFAMQNKKNIKQAFMPVKCSNTLAYC